MVECMQHLQGSVFAIWWVRVISISKPRLFSVKGFYCGCFQGQRSLFQAKQEEKTTIFCLTKKEKGEEKFKNLEKIRKNYQFRLKKIKNQKVIVMNNKSKTVNDLLYSKSAAARILGVDYQEIEKVQYWRTGVWIKLIGKKPTIISKKAFCQHFVDWRKSRCHNLVAVKDQQVKIAWDVYNPQRETGNRLFQHKDKIICTCEDYQNQTQLFSRACCKHAYKVLAELNFNSLQDYILYHQSQAA